MSTPEQAIVSLLSQFALSFDGAFLGVTLAYAAVRSIVKYTSSSSALRRLRSAPSVRVSDLRLLLNDDDSASSASSSSSASRTSDGESSSAGGMGEGKLVILRGVVEAKSNVDGSNGWKGLRGNNQGVLVSQESGDRAVIIQRTQTCIYNEWRGIFKWTYDLRAVFSRSLRQCGSTSVRTVPFVLIDGGPWPHADYVLVNLDGSTHMLPLATVFHQLQPVNASPYTFLQALFGHEYPVGVIDEERILPLGSEISAVGVCTYKTGVPEIRSCKDLPYFLIEKTKDEMLVDLALTMKRLYWSSIIIGSASLIVLGVSIVRNWNRWKQSRQQRQNQQLNQATIEQHGDETTEDEPVDVPDGQLCVICLMRRRRSAFVPCGHLVCCQRCALSVEREDAPKCPVCRQSIRNSVRIYDS
ncbi:hypothetical protein MLD38_007868 [Melastoma candidum]|uniref:Uncharacterized protein n=1 Tax=Melastoma candidum TaxID=119954 RepID=A0ACB9RTU1_9MYRT|nr:hypothetical protein MLD38_007868 [Melastoma candidum]